MMGIRAIYATHLHGLAASVAELNEDTPGESKVLSMVALIEADSEPGEQNPSGSRESLKIRPTFKIVPGPPEGHGYAIDLAYRLGISKDHLISMLVQRGELVTSS
jgi:hypothetical protein